ncbi:MAG: membrane or secreted protein [Bacteroidota bacterium]
MKIFILTFFTCWLSFTGLSGQSLIGAWENTSPDDDGQMVKSVVIFSEGFQVATWFDAKTGAFIKTNGGKWELNGSSITETVEFDSDNPERVGSQVAFEIVLDGNTLKVIGDDMIMTRIDDGSPGKLSGAWLISGRMRDGKIQQRDTNRPRKTMKILSGTRFQWIAYNTETKEFMGTGGGTYTSENGKYVENIGFFSRDDSRVGASLSFDFKLENGNWHHSGKSSKGSPIYEIWSPRKK